MSFPNGTAVRTPEQIMEDLVMKQRLDDARQQCKTILGDEDAHYLIRELKQLRSTGTIVRLHGARRFHFLSDDAEVVLNQQGDPDSYQVVDMPSGSCLRKIEGSSYKSAVFRIDNGLSGAERETVDLAFRKVDSGDYLLYLKARKRGERVSSGRRAGMRQMGVGPDRSL